MANQLSNGVSVNKTQSFASILSNKANLLDLKDKSSEEITSAMWGIQPALIQEIGNMSRVYASKHGMFASVPIICRGPDCAYKDVCMVSTAQRTIGQRCPMEIAAILARYELWCAHFDININQDTIDPRDLVDATLIKDLVNTEVQMMRAENKIALNGDFMADTLLDIDKKCVPYYGKIVSPEVEFLLSLHNQKVKILNQLNATRKDKASDKSQNAASDMAIRIFQQVQEMERNRINIVNISDIEFDEQGEAIVSTLPPVETLVGGESNGTGQKNAQGSMECDNNG